MENLAVEVVVKKARKELAGQKESIITAELIGWESKEVIMKKKEELSRGIFIEDDLTKKEMEMQRRLGKIAKEQRVKGDKNVKVGYRKIYIGKRWYWWDERREKLQEERSGRRD
ncbi:hypothetical protein KM043_015918 [Ampulex compressa]|nr:hypothetical protein KM043_015918 [Ampulex compressa]